MSLFGKPAWLLVLLGGGTIAIIWVGVVAFRILTQENLSFGKGSIEYHLLIKSPVMRAIADPRYSNTYHYSAGEGPKPPGNGLSSQSESIPRDFIAGLDSYFKKNGYAVYNNTLASCDLNSTQTCHRMFTRYDSSEDVYVKHESGVWTCSVHEYQALK